MRAREAKKLQDGDEIIIKETGFAEIVSYIEIHGDDVYIFTYQGSDYSHKDIA